MFRIEYIYGTFKKHIFKNIFSICLIGIIGTSLVDIPKVTFPKGNK